MEGFAYVVFQDIFRNQGLVNAGIFVGLEVYERIFGDTLVGSRA